MNNQRNNITQENTIFVPQPRRGAIYLESLHNHDSTQTINYLPYVSLAISSILDNQYSSSSTSTEIQFGGNDEQQPHILSTHDPEQMRAMRQIEIETIMEQIHISDQFFRFEMRDSQTERRLTEDEIMKCIRCENFEDTIEGTLENQELCSICQEEYQTGEEIGKLDCAHIFHLNCIKEWLVENNKCPLCKRGGLCVV